MSEKGSMPDYIVKSVHKDEKGVERWANIGVAFVNDDSVSIKLNALPMGANIVLMKPKSKEERQA